MATIWVSPDAVPQLRYPTVSLADGSAGPEPAPLRSFHWPGLGRRVLDAPLDRRTRLRQSWALWLFRINLFVVLPLLLLSYVAALALAVYGLSDLDREPSFSVVAFPLWNMVAVLVLIAVQGAVLGLSTGPSARRDRAGALTVEGVHPAVVQEWLDANAPGAVRVLVY